jgi:uroporphyrin-III C-methyltransferase/precorrin-2 dehydrogenase/sirohydrochlorin ferrochelatase
VIGYRKAAALHAMGAVITAVSPEFVPEWDTLDGVTRIVRCYESADIEGRWLVVTATNDPVAQQQVYDDGERLGIWVNAADDPDRCAFILPAVVRRGPVIVAVSTQGRSPVLASRLRDKLAAALPADLEERVERLSAERDRIHAEGGSTEVVDWSAFVDDL